MLNGIKVLDLTRVVAGPAGTRTLADFGATIWKVEPPEGDLMRRGVPKVNGVALGFAQQNAGKENLCVDLKQPAGVDLVLALARQADVLVEFPVARFLLPFRMAALRRGPKEKSRNLDHPCA